MGKGEPTGENRPAAALAEILSALRHSSGRLDYTRAELQRQHGLSYNQMYKLLALAADNEQIKVAKSYSFRLSQKN